MIIRGRDTVEETTVENIHGGKGNCHAKRLIGNEPLLDVPGFPGDFESYMDSCMKKLWNPVPQQVYTRRKAMKSCIL